MPSPDLFSPLDFGAFVTRNRIFMAPMTRGRATSDGTPTDIMATYYRQRSTAGLIVSEATSISPQGRGWLNAPGIYTDAQEAAWRPVTDAVHAEGGRVLLQLWHMGRVSHPDFLDGELPVGPSAIAAAGESRTANGKKPYVTPRALDATELPGIAADYAAAAGRAMAAGFDGVEIHGANGYLLDQFIRDGSNQRTDGYGGSIEARWRFPLEVAAAVAETIGADRTGIRLSPSGAYNGMTDSDPIATFGYGAAQLQALNLAFIHVMEPVPGHMARAAGSPAVCPVIRESFRRVIILNGGRLADNGHEAIRSGEADAIAMGVPFLANPDLPRRFAEGAELQAPDFGTFYTAGPQGYTDYPSL